MKYWHDGCHSNVCILQCIMHYNIIIHLPITFSKAVSGRGGWIVTYTYHHQLLTLVITHAYASNVYIAGRYL